MLNREQLETIIDKYVKDLTVEQFAGLFINPVTAVDEFSKLCNGERCGNRISLLFNPHRLDTKGVQNGFGHTLYSGISEPSYRSGLARLWAHKYTQAKDDTFYWATQRGYNGIPAIAEFPPYVSRKIYLEYKDNKTKYNVFDPCAGCGGRMIGCATIPNSTYTACEPSTKTYDGLCRLGEWLKILQPTFEFEVKNIPFEEFTTDKTFDFALTSPPYYDTEMYSTEDTNSMIRYKTYQDWVDGFYSPFILKAVSLVGDGVFVLNIGDRKYSLSDSMEKICSANDIFVERTHDYLVGRGEAKEKFYCLSKKKSNVKKQLSLF